MLPQLSLVIVEKKDMLRQLCYLCYPGCMINLSIEDPISAKCGAKSEINLPQRSSKGASYADINPYSKSFFI